MDLSKYDGDGYDDVVVTIKHGKKFGRRRYFPSNTQNSFIVNAETGETYPYRVGSLDSRYLFKMVDTTGVCDNRGYELDPREYMSDQSRPVPFSPHGAVDGMICSSDLAKNMAFLGKFGSSCNIGFDASEFIQKHKQFKNFDAAQENYKCAEMKMALLKIETNLI